jgi:hypothetical protein
VEAFWRTLIENLGDADGTHPAPEAMGEAFGKTLMVLWSLVLADTQYQGDHQYQAAMGHMKPLTALAQSAPEVVFLLPSMEEILEQKDCYAVFYDLPNNQVASEAGLLADDEEIHRRKVMQQINDAAKPAAPYFGQLNTVMLDRRVFRTKCHLLGLGPESLAVGDHIFILPGARVPFVLRPVSAKESTSSSSGSRVCYELVGEAYIHCIMQGEVLDQLISGPWIWILSKVAQ